MCFLSNLTLLNVSKVLRNQLGFYSTKVSFVPGTGTLKQHATFSEKNIRFQNKACGMNISISFMTGPYYIYTKQQHVLEMF